MPVIDVETQAKQEINMKSEGTRSHYLKIVRRNSLVIFCHITQLRVVYSINTRGSSDFFKKLKELIYIFGDLALCANS